MGRPGAKQARLKRIDDEFGTFCVNETQRLFEELAGRQPDSDRTAEDVFNQSVPRERRKRLGQFFTPIPVAALMAEWVLQNKPRSILDPAVGTGVLVRALAEQGYQDSIAAFDIDELCVRYASASMPPQTEIQVCDFLLAPIDRKFEGVIANPPYLRHHDIHYDHDIFGEFSRQHGVTLSKLSNLYVLFLLRACSLLAEGGRASIIVPAEWTNANFGSALKTFLIRNQLLRHVIYFDHTGLVFEDNLSTGCVLLIEKTKFTGPIHTHYVPADFERMTLPQLLVDASIRHQEFSSDVLLVTRKWDHLVANGQLREQPGWVALRKLAKTRRGIATGSNDFFFLRPSEVAEFGIQESNVRQCIGRAQDVPSYRFSVDDLQTMIREDRRCCLLDFSGEPNKTEMAYLQRGIDAGMDTRFLTKSRSPWYAMERRDPSPIWAAVFGRGNMRFVYNQAGIRNLTTFHCIYPNNNSPEYSEALVACLNSNLVQSRAKARLRVYGGGLNKFEPGDLLDIEVPDLDAVSPETLCEIATHFRRLDDSFRQTGEEFTVTELDRFVEQVGGEARASRLI